MAHFASDDLWALITPSLRYMNMFRKISQLVIKCKLSTRINKKPELGILLVKEQRRRVKRSCPHKMAYICRLIFGVFFSNSLISLDDMLLLNSNLSGKHVNIVT